MALGEIGDPNAIDPLTYMARHDEELEVRNAAKEALENIENPTVELSH